MSVIELGITVIILGITFVMALQGAAFVDAMRGFMTRYKIEHIQTRVLLYQDQFGALPGDDPQAAARWQLPNPVIRLGGGIVSGRGNGKVEGLLFDGLVPTGEQFMFWSHMRAARLFEGDRTLVGLTSMPENAFGGVIGIDGGNLGQKNGSICASRIPGAIAQSIDKAIDDGAIDTGRLVATARYSIEESNHFDAPDSEPYNLEKEYIICLPLAP